jgi:vacuolar-type H+-ATPase subunit H
VEQDTINSLGLVAVAIVTGYFALRSATAQARLRKAEDDAKQKIVTAEIKAKEKVEAARIEASQDEQLRQDLLLLFTKQQETIERQRKEIANSGDKIDEIRQRSHKLQDDANKVVNELQTQVLRLTERLGDMRTKYEHEMGLIAARQMEEHNKCEAQIAELRHRQQLDEKEIQALRDQICAGELEIQRLSSELERFRKPPAQSEQVNTEAIGDPVKTEPGEPAMGFY